MLLSQMLARNNNIYHLDLSNNKLGGAGIMQLLKGLARNKRFHSIEDIMYLTSYSVFGFLTSAIPLFLQKLP